MSNFSELHLPKCELQAEVINIVRSNVVGRTLVEIAKVMEV